MGTEFDFSELRGRIIAKFGNNAAFAKAWGRSTASLSGKLNSRVAFKPEDIFEICSPELLDIPPAEIGRYFFTPKV